MNRIDTILVASDLSDQADIALQRAASLAREHRARVEVLHVLEDCAGSFLTKEESEELCRELIHNAEGKLRQQVDRTIGEGVEFACRVEMGKDFIVIIREARRQKADLVVMAAHGGHTIRGLFLGTTPEKVVRKGEGATLTVRRPSSGPYQCVLVASDFSENSREGLLAARILAPQARFHLLHVLELWGQGRFPPEGGDQKLSLYHQRAREQAETGMEEFLRGIEPGGELGVRHIRHGHAPAEILSLAADLDADLIATGTEGRSGLPQILLGSVAERVLWEAPCDVLTVKSPKFHFELP